MYIYKKVSKEFCFLTDFDLLKTVTSTNTKPEVVRTTVIIINSNYYTELMEKNLTV